MNAYLVEEHSILKTIILALLPGLLILAFFLIIAPFSDNLGIPSLLVILIAIIIVLVPFELGYLYYQAKKINGNYSLRNIVLYREKVPLWQYILLIFFSFGWCLAAFGPVSAAIDPFLIKNYFGWLPKWFFINTMGEHIGQYSKSVLLWTWIIGLLFNGIIAPVVEELYFRGYLMPRMNRMKAWAPLVNALLFSLYHFFTPWQNPVRIIALVPLLYIVWWKRNIYIGMITHCTLNVAGVLFMVPLIFK